MLEFAKSLISVTGITAPAYGQGVYYSSRHARLSGLQPTPQEGIRYVHGWWEQGRTAVQP